MYNIPDSITKDWTVLYKFRIKDWHKTEFKYLPEDECRKIARERKVLRDAFPKWLDLTAMRYKPSDLVKLNRYNWTGTKEWEINEFDFTMQDISESWIWIKSNQPLNVWDKVNLDIMLDKKYSLSWIVKRKWVNMYWIQFIKPDENDRFSSLAINYKKLVTMIISKVTH